MIFRRRPRPEPTDPFQPVPTRVPRAAPAPVAQAPRENPEKVRLRAERRLKFTAACFVMGFATVAVKMGAIAASEAREPSTGSLSGATIVNARADITDREGRVLATNVTATALYAQPHKMLDPVAAAEGLARIFPDMDAETWARRFTSGSKFFWLKGNISPEQQQAVHDLGEPGLLFGSREMRLYPNGPLAAHVLGGARYGAQDVRAAEIVGVAGVEKTFDAYLSDPAQEGAPLRLSLDLPIQAAVEHVLDGGMKLMNAKGAAAILMDIKTGEVISLASLPDFDPNSRPRPATEGDPADSPLFNRAVQGVYELGSTFKIFTTAQSLELGLTNAGTMIDTRGPLRQGRHSIRDFRNYGPQLSVADVIRHSSNVGTARMALDIGATRQKAFLESLGFFEPTPLEMVEAASGRPIVPERWPDITTMTVSYGHGLSTSPLHLAVGYASVLNGGTRVTPTLMAQETPPPLGPRIVSARVSAESRHMLRRVVTDGTASMGEVPGYHVGGKTGTADKPKHTGGYWEDKVIATFASVFPAHDPKYVLIVTLDEPEIRAAGEDRRTAGWTAVPVASEIVRRVAPLLGVRPDFDPAKDDFGAYLTQMARR
ncbi:peptidoglycan D,D-transpeptidase FtsI family protein [Jannaschia seohaensis]|uniref:Cell division protein FtsI (Penicillin-binding protein 3) n=1 Tax=Jannaschia seohaensis TaxID=475081 RepID=A0A2Y9B3N1_9RHOB|nr:penicillin-binding protein 2 [Jannaschia seohaensis]PWJ13279.1 cell division protein FtsI (penicillin-binding protein 3) [Jannaschia seohaensis]SSA50605.1 cell division protein FtsI (penicillin-binding protein 3) [Jannaschia seohaensis]